MERDSPNFSKSAGTSSRFVKITVTSTIALSHISLNCSAFKEFNKGAPEPDEDDKPTVANHSATRLKVGYASPLLAFIPLDKFRGIGRDVVEKNMCALSLSYNIDS